MFEILLTVCLAGDPATCTTELHPGGETLESCRAAATELAARANGVAQEWPCAEAGATPSFTVTEVAPGVFVHRGVHAEAAAENQGDLANIGFVVGTDSVAVIDAGGSAAVARDLLAAIRRETDLPVRWLVLTHMHPDHVLGAPVFEAEGATVVGHADLARALGARRETYLEANAELIGPGFEGSGTPAEVDPVDVQRKIDLGGRVLLLEAHPTAHTDNDLTVFDTATGTWFLGDLLFIDHLPAIDGSIAGWIELDATLATREAARAVPGHGPVAVQWPVGGDPLRQYLAALAAAVRDAIRAGVPIQDVTATVGAEMAEGWLLVGAFHGRNVLAAFKELEWE